MIGGAVGPHSLHFGPHRRVGRWRDDSELEPEAECIGHLLFSFKRALPRSLARNSDLMSSAIMRSAYFCCISNRFAWCGPAARSPTQSSATTAMKPLPMASTPLAPTHPAVV